MSLHTTVRPAITGPELSALAWATNGNDRTFARMIASDAQDYAVMIARTRAAMNGNTPAEVQRHVDKYPVIHTRMNARQAG